MKDFDIKTVGSDQESIIIPTGITSIRDRAFYNSVNLKIVVIPEGVISIGQYAFARCTALETVYLPESLTSIGESAFENCKALKRISLPSSITRISDSTFDGCASLESVKFPDMLLSIGRYAFNNCSSLKSIIFPEHLKSIGESAFENCKALTDIVFSENLDSIQRSAFSLCKSLTSVKLPNSLKVLGEGAFNCCDNLMNVEAPYKLSVIGSPFLYCEKLKQQPSFFCKHYKTANSKNTTTFAGCIHDNTIAVRNDIYAKNIHKNDRYIVSADNYNIITRDGVFLGMPIINGGCIYPLSADCVNAPSFISPKFNKISFLIVKKDFNLKFDWKVDFSVYDRISGKTFDVHGNILIYPTVDDLYDPLNLSLFMALYNLLTLRYNKHGDYEEYNTEHWKSLFENSITEIFQKAFSEYIENEQISLENYVPLKGDAMDRLTDMLYLPLDKICRNCGLKLNKYGFNYIQPVSLLIVTEHQK